MAYPKILQRLFEDFGAGPKLRGDILPFGSKEGTACEGNDARLSNARVPETHNETHKTGGADPLTPADIGAHPADGMASTDKEGIVRLSSAIDMDSEDQASTPKAVKTAYELADTAKSMATEAQGKADAAYEKAMLDATTAVAGRTQLSSEVNSDREDMAATPKAVKSVHDKAIEASSAASAAQTLAASAESTATAAKTNADKVPEISTQVKALGEKVQAASPDKLGMVRIGQGISVDETGLISTEPVTLATPDAPGIVQVGAGLEVTLPTEVAEGEEAPTPGILSLGAHASENPDAYGKGDFQFYGHVKLTDNFEEGTAAKDGVAISAKGVKDAWDRLLNLQSEVVITSSGNWTVPETATYAVTCIAGGGKGGNGSTGVASSWSACRWGSESVERYGSDINHGGNGGGGGGAGQTITQNVKLTKGDIIPVTIGGGDGGSTAFGEHLTALGGGTGGNGVAPTYRGVSPSNCHDGPGSFSGGPGSGGAAGFSYGSPPSGGGVGDGGSGYWGGSSSKFLGYVSGGNGGAGGTSTHGAYGNGGIGGNGAPVNKTSVGSASSGGNGTQGAVIIVINALST
jgi:hypothetical protein